MYVLYDSQKMFCMSDANIIPFALLLVYVLLIYFEAYEYDIGNNGIMNLIRVGRNGIAILLRKTVTTEWPSMKISVRKYNVGESVHYYGCICLILFYFFSKFG
jgi:hypothetical protein